MNKFKKYALSEWLSDRLAIVIHRRRKQMAGLTTYVQKGILNFPKFVTPQSYDNEQNKFINDLEGGEFSTGLLVDQKALDFITEQLYKEKELFLKSEKYEKLTAKGQLEIVEETNFVKIEEGKIELKFKRSAFNKAGKKAKIEFLDSFKKDLSSEQIEEIGSGSLAKIGFCIYSWALLKEDRAKIKYISFGITLCLLGAQILDLKRNSSIKDMFEQEEEGYSAEASELY
jgi:hypothetical protein